MSNQAGKGDKPRNNFSRKFRDNYDSIDWGSSKPKSKQKSERDQKTLEACLEIRNRLTASVTKEN
jgi:hypothetical protein